MFGVEADVAILYPARSKLAEAIESSLVPNLVRQRDTTTSNGIRGRECLEREPPYDLGSTRPRQPRCVRVATRNADGFPLAFPALGQARESARRGATEKRS